MESPVVLDKPPEYHSKGTQNNNDKGFPFDEDEAEGGAGGAWGSLAARHPDIAARLRARPSAWGRKRRSSHGGTSGTSGDGARPVAHADDDFPAGLGEHFDRFPFDDIPPEFREHFPGHWGQRFTPREREREPPAPQPAPPQTHSPPPQHKPHQNTISTQTEEDPIPTPIDPPGAQNPGPSGTLPQYGLRNTVDLGQKTPADPSFVDAEEERNQRSMSAPPDNRMPTPSYPGMGNSTGGSAQPPPEHHDHGASNVRHIPIFVEGRDEPIVNRAHPEAAAYAEPKQQYAPPPPQPDRDYYEPGMGFHHPPNFSRAFGTPFGKGYRQGPQPFAPQKAYQQSSAPPGRSQSPKPQPPPQQQYTQIPVHQQNVPPPAQRQQSPQPPPPQRQPSPQPPPPQRQGSPPPPPPQPAPPMNDPIAKILSIQKDVLDLMTDVENFVGTKADKRYIYLDEMLTRNLIKLDDIETEGKENIRQARKEAIKCIQKCIAVLEAKADGKIPTTPQPAAVEMNLEQNGRAEGDAQPKQSEPAAAPAVHNPNLAPTDNNPNPTKESGEEGGVAGDAPEPTTEDTMAVPKKTKKVVKKRDKSKDNNTNNDANQNEENQAKDVEMQVAQNSDSNQANPPPMESEGSAVSSQ